MKICQEIKPHKIIIVVYVKYIQRKGNSGLTMSHKTTSWFVGYKYKVLIKVLKVHHNFHNKFTQVQKRAVFHYYILKSQYTVNFLNSKLYITISKTIFFN